MLENKKVKNNLCEDVHMSRLIASWYNAVGDYYDGDFEGWLESLGIDQATIRDIVEMWQCGKLELEKNAREYNKHHPVVVDESDGEVYVRRETMLEGIRRKIKSIL